MKLEKTCSCSIVLKLQDHKETADKNEFGYWVKCPECGSCNLFPKWDMEIDLTQQH